jgi:LCP family protein required for cell wall assembly
VKRALAGLLLISALVAGCRPGPTPPTATPSVPSPAPPGDMNLLLLGIDERPQGEDEGWRTDTLIVVAIRPKTQVVAMLSIPRDLWVEIPGHGYNRINEADYLGETIAGPGGGPALVAATLQENLGIPVHAYARIRFQGLQRIIDALGGIDIDVPRPFDEMIDAGDGSQQHFRLDPGLQHMDGRTALLYARSRHGVTDMDRSRRQQQVLLALRDAALRPETLPRVPGLIRALADTVETNLGPAAALGLINLARRIEPEAYRTRVFDHTMVSDWVTPTGAMVLVPRRERIAQVWDELTAPAAATTSFSYFS